MSEATPKRVSVIAPVFDEKAHLPTFFRALRAQEAPGCPCEVIVVDDGSTDGSRAILDAAQAAEAVGSGLPVRLVTQPHRGPYVARNRGAAHASGDVLAFTDADCAPEPGWLRTIVGGMSDPQVGVLVGHRRPAGDTKALVLLDAWERAKETFVFTEGEPAMHFAQASNLAVRRSLVDPERPFDERMRGADVLLVRRLVERHGPDVLRYCPDMRVRHLEVRTARAHLAKYRAYGTSLELYRRVLPCRSVGRHRLGIYRRAVAENGLSGAEALRLLALLSWGMLQWSLGSLRGRLLRREPGSYSGSYPG